MKKIFLMAFVATLTFSNTSHAGFAVKKIAPSALVTVEGNHEAPLAITGSTPVSTVDQVNVPAAKQTFAKKMIAKLKGGAEISKPLYVVLAIIGFGWLGMGINDNFEGWDWVLSLVLYILLYLPGLIYTLVKMKKYYK